VYLGIFLHWGEIILLSY